MFSSAARLRRCAVATLAGLALVPFVNARDEVLFTSSVSYCAPPELVLVEKFDIVYFAANQSIFFNVSAASVEANVNVTANLAVNVYGMQPLNITLDLCNILNGVLCPLPTYNFVGTETIPLPSTIDVASHLPAIAYKIPDLEAFAQLTLTRVDTGEVKACVQATLSNGWSTRQRGVGWGTGALAFLALLSALLHSLLCSPEARAPFRLLDLFGLYQSIAASALLDLNYPVVYRAFAANFAWALGLFESSNGLSIQGAINNMRHLTGGTMSDAAGGTGVALVNRRLSPYNVMPGGGAEATSAVQDLQTKIAANFLVGGAKQAVKRDVATVTSSSSNVLDAGIPVFVNSIGISTANAFMSVFLTLLMLTAIALFVLAVGWGVLVLVLRSREKKEKSAGKLEEWKEYYPWFSRAWALRLTLIVYFPVAIFAFHQWTLKDSWLATLFSVITLLAVLGAIIYPSYLTIRFVRRERPWTLYRDTPHLMSSGPLYIQYRHQRWFFFLIPLSAILVRAIIIAFAIASGLTQVIILLITELAVLGSTLVLKPNETRGGDVLASTLAVARVFAVGLSFAFVESFNVNAIPRVVIGFVIVVIFGFSVILMLINTLVNLGLRTLWRERIAARFGTRIGSSWRVGPIPEPAEGSVMDEKRGVVDAFARETPSASQPELLNTDRPRNPTPQHNIPLDPTLNEPYPEVTPTASSAFAPSYYASSAYPSPGDTSDSGFGSVLPRRPSYEGLGLDRLDMEEGGTSHTSHSPATARFSSASSTTPSTPHSFVGGRKGSQRESWTPSAALPRMSENVERPGALATIDDEREREEGRRSQ
ncbi:TRP-domain-containing protein [Phellopilus nigrolimitatus]|nr:TRP-domain-containing protein [Phellopilus nigrolimitatus]